jgi:magnesium chelatase subunit I
LPDLQPRIQVSLFNILQEGDIQIRGFMLRLPLDIQFVFTANPEDYTNRGAIITPLKDRIQSQIITHYPQSVLHSSLITAQEVKLTDVQRKNILIPDLVSELLEQIAFEARESEFIDQKSGVSARLSITAYENLVSTIERRMLLNAEETATARIADLMGVIPAVIGKIELVYEGEQEGPRNVAMHLISQSIRKKFPQIFPDPEMLKRRKTENPYQALIDWFNGAELEIELDDSEKEYKQKFTKVQGLKGLLEKYCPNLDTSLKPLYMEFILHGCAEYSLISKHVIGSSFAFTDLLNSIFSAEDEDENQ